MGIQIHQRRESNGDTLTIYRNGTDAVLVRERGNGKPAYVAATVPFGSIAPHLAAA